MSKKTKRLEKENMNLTRKHDLTNQNILKMAEERSKSNMELDGARKKNEKLTSIINQMQKQGRGMASGMAGMAEPSPEGEGEYAEGELEGTEESDYEYEEGEEGDEESGEYDEDTEEEVLPEAPRPFGPVPPPAPIANGVALTANGIKH